MRITRSGFTYAVVPFFLLSVFSVADPVMAFDVFWTGGTGSWTDGNNWDTLAEPDDFFEDVPIINNGGVATLGTTAIGAAGLALGYEVGGSGTVIIENNGSLTLVETAGAAADVEPNGAANIGFEGGDGAEGDSGLLEIQGGGSFTAVTYDINQNGTLRIGTGAGAASATTSTGSLFSNGTLEVVGSGHTFSIAGNATFEEKAEGNSRFVPRISGLSHTVMTVAGDANLGGSLAPVFEGYIPQVGDSWDLIDAAQVQGVFDVDASGAPTPAAGTAYRTRVVNGGNGRILQLTYDAFATMRVNTDSGAVTILSESGAPIDIVGYSILSSSGNLNPANWNTLASQGATGFEVAGAPSVNSVNELSAQGSFAIDGTTRNMGAIYTQPTAFGNEVNITFEYAMDGDTQATQGIVQLTGSAATNNLLLTVDPTTGEGQLQNNSNFNIELLGYSIISDDGSLDALNWESLDSNSIPNWDEAAADEFSLNELVPEGTASLFAGQAYSLGELFAAGGSQDLELEFVLAIDGQEEIRQGVVQYGEIIIVEGLEGDYNNNGTVDAADYAVWRENLGVGSLVNEGAGISPGVVDSADFTFWKSRFGATSGAAAASGAGQTAPAPEPSTLTIILLGALGFARVRVRQAI